MEDVSKFLVGRTEEYANAAERPTGTVSVPSGRLRIIDPFFEARYGCVLWVPPGQHRAFITYIHIDDDLGWCPAYLSFRFTEAQRPPSRSPTFSSPHPSRWSPARSVAATTP